MSPTPLPRILPFALFMAFIAVEEFAAGLFDSPLPLYPLKAVTVALALFLLRKSYGELRLSDLRHPGNTAISLATGILIFVLWIHLDWTLLSPSPPTAYDSALIPPPGRTALILTRLFGAVLVVPVMEELFWRSFLLRYLIDKDFSRVAVGVFTWPSFLITALLFGLEHHYILAGIVAGAAFNLLLYHTRSIVQCTLAHAVANLALGLYVLQSGEWRFW